jgi:FKBP-type peptidyl-prolyl cis-trans isomerase
MNKKLTILMFCGLILAVSCKTNLKKGAVSSTKLKSQVDSVSYAIGHNLGSTFKKQGFEKINLEIFNKAIAEGLAEVKNPMSEEQAMNVVNSFMMKSFEDKNKDAKGKESKFLEENKKKANIKTTPSGLQYEVIKEGSGEKPTATSTVKVHYKGTLTDGTTFDSSYDRNEPTEFPLNQVIKGWTEGIQLMTPGSKYKFYIPSELAYGPQGNEVIGPYEPLTFEVELLEVK